MKYVLVAMPQVLWFLLTPVLLLSQPTPPPGCPSTCGKVHIPYPFGIGDNCAWPGFTLTCNHRFNPPRLYYTNEEVIDMTLETGEMRVFTSVTYTCIGEANPGYGGLLFNYTSSPFLISSERNVFTAIGCSTMMYLEGRDDMSYFSGCITTCESVEGAAKDGDECTGLGCCQAGILSNLSTIAVVWDNDVNDTVFNKAARINSPCSYGFVAEKGWYKFSRKDLNDTGDRAFYRRVGDRSIPMVLDWAIRSNGTCPPSPANLTAAACVSSNSYCTNANERQGYLCKCSRGYSGNPYVTGGCKSTTTGLGYSNTCMCCYIYKYVLLGWIATHMINDVVGHVAVR